MSGSSQFFSSFGAIFRGRDRFFSVSAKIFRVYSQSFSVTCEMFWRDVYIFPLPDISGSGENFYISGEILRNLASNSGLGKIFLSSEFL